MKGKLDKGLCQTYNQYWPCKAAMLRHKTAHKKKSHGDIEKEKSDEEQTEEGGEKVGCQATIEGVKNMLVFDNKQSSPNRGRGQIKEFMYAKWGFL